MACSWSRQWRNETLICKSHALPTKVIRDEKIDAFVPGKSKQNETTVGSANGIFNLEETIGTSFEKGYQLSNN